MSFLRKVPNRVRVLLSDEFQSEEQYRAYQLLRAENVRQYRREIDAEVELPAHAAQEIYDHLLEQEDLMYGEQIMIFRLLLEQGHSLDQNQVRQLIDRLTVAPEGPYTVGAVLFWGRLERIVGHEGLSGDMLDHVFGEITRFLDRPDLHQNVERGNELSSLLSTLALHPEAGSEIYTWLARKMRIEEREEGGGPGGAVCHWLISHQQPPPFFAFPEAMDILEGSSQRVVWMNLIAWSEPERARRLFGRMADEYPEIAAALLDSREEKQLGSLPPKHEVYIEHPEQTRQVLRKVLEEEDLQKLLVAEDPAVRRQALRFLSRWKQSQPDRPEESTDRSVENPDVQTLRKQ